MANPTLYREVSAICVGLAGGAGETEVFDTLVKQVNNGDGSDSGTAAT